MEDKDQIIKNLLRAKIELIADRNQRSAIIKYEMNLLRNELKEEINELAIKIRNHLQ